MAESGNAFGLDHQELYDSNGDLLEEYNPGDTNRTRSWATATRPSAAWWYGANDESADEIQDDMAIIAGANNGFGYRPDDVADTADAATPLTANSSVVVGSGIIGKMDDLDYWSFKTDQGPVMLFVSVPVGINNLDVKAKLVDGAGNDVVPWQDMDLGFDATILANLSPGTYFLVVGSHGNYGDVGQYRVSGMIVPPKSPPPAPSGLVATAVSSDNVDLAWTIHTTNAFNYVVERSLDGHAWTMAASLPGSSTSFVDSGLTPATPYFYKVYAIGMDGPSDESNLAFATTLPGFGLPPRA